MRHILILGAGGHAQVVANILLQAYEAGNNVRPIGYVDDNPARQGQVLLGLPVLGTIADTQDIPHDALIIAIGNNATRRSLFEEFQQQGECFAVAIHPTAIIAPDVPLGTGTVISAGVIINPGSTIGENVILNTGCTIEHHNHIGEHAHVAPGVRLAGDVQVGPGTLVGTGAIVIPGCRIGAWSTVGAGAVVTSNLPDHVVAVGIPCRVAKFTLANRAPHYAYAQALP